MSNINPNKGPTVNTQVQCTAANPTGRGYCGTILMEDGACPRCGAVKAKRGVPSASPYTRSRRTLSPNQCDTPGCGTILLPDGSCPRCEPVAARSAEERRVFATEMEDTQLAAQLDAEEGIEPGIPDAVDGAEPGDTAEPVTGRRRRR